MIPIISFVFFIFTNIFISPVNFIIISLLWIFSFTHFSVYDNYEYVYIYKFIYNIYIYNLYIIFPIFTVIIVTLQ